MLSIISFVCTLFGQPGYPVGEKINLDDYELVWSDEFDGDSLDTTKWDKAWWKPVSVDVRKGGYWTLATTSVKDGCLHIGTRYYENGPFGNSAAGWYTGGIETQYKFETTYGYFETRCILPKGAGIWSAFWLMGRGVENIDGSGVDGTEIDVFESAYYSDGKNSDTVSSALHYDGYDESHKQTTVHRTHVYGSNPYEEFNTYGVKWTEKEYIFYINGVECGRSTFGGVCKNDLYLLLSVEVGGNDGVPAKSWAGEAIKQDAEPTDFIVDYVRVYK